MKIFIALVIIFLSLSLPCGAAQNFYTRGNANSNEVALTFDDGPGLNTQKILDILKEKNVKATFFMLGTSVKKRPLTAKKVAEAGHEIANHTYNHINFSEYTDADKKEKFETELLTTQSEIEKATGVKPRLVRSPNGYNTSDARRIASANGYTMINWTFGCDWDISLTAREMHAKYKAAITPGAIFLMHDLSSDYRVPSFLAQFIDDIRAKGLEPVTVSKLLWLNP
jgi:peptidoglycan/xylan/chitin deacetylase (PgdA/CDA1 family)